MLIHWSEFQAVNVKWILFFWRDIDPNDHVDRDGARAAIILSYEPIHVMYRSHKSQTNLGACIPSGY